MKATELYIAAASAALETLSANPAADIEPVLKKHFLATGLKATADYHLFKQHANFFRGPLSGMVNDKLPSEIAAAHLEEVATE